TAGPCQSTGRLTARKTRDGRPPPRRECRRKSGGGARRSTAATSCPQTRPDLLRGSSHRRIAQLDRLLAGQRALRVPEPQLERQRLLTLTDLLAGVDVEQRHILQPVAAART